MASSTYIEASKPQRSLILYAARRRNCVGEPSPQNPQKAESTPPRADRPGHEVSVERLLWGDLLLGVGSGRW